MLGTCKHKTPWGEKCDECDIEADRRDSSPASAGSRPWLWWFDGYARYRKKQVETGDWSKDARVTERQRLNARRCSEEYFGEND